MTAICVFQKRLLQGLQCDVQVSGAGPCRPAFHTQRVLLRPEPGGPSPSIHLCQGQFWGGVEVWARDPDKSLVVQ